MRFIKLALISFIFFFLLLTFFSLLIPSEVRISRATDINEDAQTVREYLTDYEKWRLWYPNADSIMFIGLGQDIKKGDNQEGLHITKIDPVAVEAESVGESSRKINMSWNLIPESNNAGLTVQWSMDFKMKWYPWEKFSSLFLDKKYGTYMERGLGNLKDVINDKR